MTRGTLAECGHCHLEIRKMARMWCHTDCAAYETFAHIAEPAPHRCAKPQGAPEVLCAP